MWWQKSCQWEYLFDPLFMCEKWLALKCALFAGMPGWVLMTSPLAASAHTHHLYLTLQRPTTQREQTMLNYKCICQDWQMCLSKLDNVSVKLAANVHHLYLNVQQAPHQREENREILNVSVHVRKSFCSKMANSTSDTLHSAHSPIAHTGFWDKYCHNNVFWRWPTTQNGCMDLTVINTMMPDLSFFCGKWQCLQKSETKLDHFIKSLLSSTLCLS